MRQPKQQRAVETRESILHAAAAVFDEMGYAGAGINRILERAGATAGSLYFHFDSKEGLAEAVMSRQSQRILPHLGARGLQWLMDLTFVWAWQLQSDILLRAGVRLTTEAGILRIADAAKPYRDWAGVMESSLREARDLGELQAGVDPGQVAEQIVASCTGMQLFSEAVSDDRADLPERTLRMWQLLLPGIAVPATVVRLDLDPGRVKTKTLRQTTEPAPVATEAGHPAP